MILFCWDKLIPHTVIGKFFDITIAITEGGGGNKNGLKWKSINTWEIASKLWHIPWKDNFTKYETYFWNHIHGRRAKLA